MAQKTDSQLTTEANIIRDETIIGANTALRVGTMFDDIIENKINNDKISDDVSLGNDPTLVPSQNAVKTYVDAFATGLLTDNGNYDPTITSQYPTSGNTLSGGAVKKGDLWYISADGTINGNSVLVGYSVRALIDNAGATTDADWSISNVGIGYVPENVANKSTDTTLGTSDIYYPSQNAVKTYVDTQVAAAVPYTPENIANKSQDIAANPSSTVLYPSNKAVADYVNLGISLQTVTDNGDETTNNIIVRGDSKRIEKQDSAGDIKVRLSENAGEGRVELFNISGNQTNLRNTLATASREIQFPDQSGTLVCSVNGAIPDNEGNVIVPTGGLTTLKVSLTSADILALNATPFTLIPAQGANTLINVYRVYYLYRFNTTAYSGGGNLSVNLGAINIAYQLNGLLSSGQDYFGRPVIQQVTTSTSYGFADTPVKLNCSVPQTLGDSTLDVYITYDVINL